jgi:hypothetical protein
MGFMDKAKKLAEQAQQKLDEAQTQFNQGGSTQGEGQSGGQKFDDHGRPIPREGAEQPPAPAGEAPPSPQAEAPAPEEPAAPPPPPQQSGDSNATPDPFKPLQQ